MSGDLPRIRAQINAKLTSLLGENDAISIIGFSGRGECEVVLEAVCPQNLADIATIRKQVDRWLRPIGMTGFKEPIQRAGEIARRLRAKGGIERQGHLFFMSDGCDNIWPRAEVLAAVEAIRDEFSAATIVEYSYYADRAFLSKIAERMGGTLILAANFDAYEPVFETAMTRKGGASKTVPVVLNAEPIGDFVFAIDGEDLRTFGLDALGGKTGVAIPAHLKQFFYLSPTALGTNAGNLSAQAYAASKEAGAALLPRHEVLDAAYAALALFAQRVQPKVIWSLLRALGDVSFIEAFAICFGKQRYSDFTSMAKAASAGAGWFLKGYDPKRAPREDAFTILDLFEVLASDKRCKVVTESDAYQYSRIGRRSVSKDLMLTVTEAEEVKGMADEVKSLADAREIAPLREVIAKLTAALTGRKAALKFRLDPAAAEEGYPIDGLVWNEDMPNLSFRVRKPGTVDLSDVDLTGVDGAKELRGSLPNALPSFQYRAYTVSKDGLVHVEWLPVRIPQVVYDTLVAAGAIDPTVDIGFFEGDGTVRIVLDLRKLPMVNQKMVSNASARSLADMQWELLKLKAGARVFGYYAPEKQSSGYVARFGDAGAAWLKENGVTESGGFAPSVTRAPATDFYIGKSLKVKVPGFSSLPSVEDVRERMSPPPADPKAKKPAKPKAITPAGVLMVPFLQAVDAFMASPEYTGSEDPKATFEAWIKAQDRETEAKKRKLQTQMAKIKFSVLISGGWFADLGTFEETKLKLDLGGEAREVEFELREDVKIEQ